MRDHYDRKAITALLPAAEGIVEVAVGRHLIAKGATKLAGTVLSDDTAAINLLTAEYNKPQPGAAVEEIAKPNRSVKKPSIAQAAQ